MKEKGESKQIFRLLTQIVINRLKIANIVRIYLEREIMNQENPLFCTLMFNYTSVQKYVRGYVLHTLKKLVQVNIPKAHRSFAKKLVLNLNKTSLDAGV